jgi:ketosteroid isomerase-like protein
VQSIKSLKLVLAIAIIFLLISFGWSTSQNAIAQTTQSENVEFRRLINEDYAALNTLDAEAFAKLYARDRDLIVYDIAPLEYKGQAALKQGIQKNLFDNLTKFKISANDDLRVTRQGDFAWTTFTWHLDARFKNGRHLQTNGRQTDIWERRNGNWLIVHEHTSAPLSP